MENRLASPRFFEFPCAIIRPKITDITVLDAFNIRPRATHYVDHVIRYGNFILLGNTNVVEVSRDV